MFNDFKAGELGPGTIVGSAAFNLFCITGVCIISIPEGQVRRIKAIKVGRAYFLVRAILCVCECVCVCMCACLSMTTCVYVCVSLCKYHSLSLSFSLSLPISLAFIKFLSDSFYVLSLTHNKVSTSVGVKAVMLRRAHLTPR